MRAKEQGTHVAAFEDKKGWAVLLIEVKNDFPPTAGKDVDFNPLMV